MDDQQREANHSNNSMEHCDFMFGTADMKVTGIKSDGSEVLIFENGNFVF